MADNDSNKYTQQLISELAQKEAEKIALVQEFAKAGDADETAERAKTAIKDMLPQAILAMKDLLATSGSDGVKAGLAKFVIQTALDPDKLADETEGTFAKLLKQMGATTKDVTKQPK